MRHAPPSPPQRSDFNAIILRCITNLKNGTSTGFDYLPAEFLKFARIEMDSPNFQSFRHLLAPTISSLFFRMMNDHTMNDSWKCAKLCPLFKKGPSNLPQSYRMLAINSVLYRLYSNVLRDLATNWAQQHQQIPSTQFGFCPGRNT